MYKFISFFLKGLLCCIFLFSISLKSQVQEDRDYCRLDCDPEMHLENVEMVYKDIKNDSIIKALEGFQTKRFPLRFVYIKSDSFAIDNEVKNNLNKVVFKLNNSYAPVGFVFNVEEIEIVYSEIKLEDLSQNIEELYNRFSDVYDKRDMITVYILDHKFEFCTVTDQRLSCSRIGGFSYILSSRTNNIVMSNYDIMDQKIVAHEFGHFFGLYHTFEDRMFGRDTPNESDCYATGDRLCDTPSDPGSLFEIYVNYSTCEMVGFKDYNGYEYKPMLENYMSYYKPCYLKEYSFTKEQILVMKLASQLNLRSRLSIER